jgi:uncharacterized membrane protein YbaN (DUF454 family)
MRGQATAREGEREVSAAGKRSITASPFTRSILIAAGVVCVGLGIAGVFVPLLPTTPFLLLAAACFIRSSDRLYRWLTTNRWVGGHVRNYMEHRATNRATKVASIAMLWCALSLAAVLFVQSWPIRALLLAVGVGVTIHLAKLRTIRRSKVVDPSEEFKATDE